MDTMKQTQQAEREAFEAHFKHLDHSQTKDAWGRPVHAYPIVRALWDGWKARAEAPAAPAVGDTPASLQDAIEHFDQSEAYRTAVASKTRIAFLEAMLEAALATAPKAAAAPEGERPTFGVPESEYVLAERKTLAELDMVDLFELASAYKTLLSKSADAPPGWKRTPNGWERTGEEEPVAWLMEPNELSHKGLKRELCFDKPIDRPDWTLTPLVLAGKTGEEEPVAMVMPSMAGGIRCQLLGVSEHLKPGTPLYTHPAQTGAALEAQERDAARYVWLCEHFGETRLPVALEEVTQCGYVADGKESIDAAIDAALSAGGRGGKATG